MSWRNVFADLNRKTAADHWIQRQREIVLRLPRWLTGTSIVTALSFGVWCVYGTHFLYRPLYRLYEDPVYAGLATIGLPLFGVIVALYGIARLLKPHPPSSLPNARVR
jgi:hypothetical protein